MSVPISMFSGQCVKICQNHLKKNEFCLSLKNYSSPKSDKIFKESTRVSMSKSKKDTDISTKGNIMREDLQLAEVLLAESIGIQFSEAQ